MPIITKLRRNKRTVIVATAVFVVALCLRLWNITDKTEFRGDQGSALVVVREAWERKEIPLHGPATSTGQYPGPLYYYLVAPPLVLSRFSPVAPAVFFSVLGAVTGVMLFIAGYMLWGTATACLIAMLYASSPVMVAWDRVMWNPTAIPFLTTAYILLFLVFRRTHRQFLIALLGMCAGGLIQLHFSTAFTVAVMLISIVVALTAESKGRIRGNLKKMVLPVLMFAAGFVFILSPYILYEIRKNWNDVISILSMYIFNPTDEVNLIPFRYRDIIARLFSFIFPFENRSLIIGAGLFVTVMAFAGRSFRSVWWICWFIAAAVYVKYTRVELHTHYLIFIMPVPFLLFGEALSVIRKRMPGIMFLTLGIVLFFMNGFIHLGNNPDLADIPRTKEATDWIMRKANGKPFSFTLTSSRSFSDYHYRAFFALRDVKPADIYGSGYAYLFLVCDSFACPYLEDMKQKSTTDVMCFDHHCGYSYESLNLNQMKYIDYEILQNSVIYIYGR